MHYKVFIPNVYLTGREISMPINMLRALRSCATRSQTTSSSFTSTGKLRAQTFYQSYCWFPLKLAGGGNQWREISCPAAATVCPPLFFHQPVERRLKGLWHGWIRRLLPQHILHIHGRSDTETDQFSDERRPWGPPPMTRGFPLHSPLSEECAPQRPQR